MKCILVTKCRISICFCGVIISITFWLLHTRNMYFAVSLHLLHSMRVCLWSAVRGLWDQHASHILCNCLMSPEQSLWHWEISNDGWRSAAPRVTKWWEVSTYRKMSNIRRTESPNLNVPRLVLQSSLPNPMKPGVKSRCSSLHLSDRQFNCLLRCD